MENCNGVSTPMCSSVPLRVADGLPYTDVTRNRCTLVKGVLRYLKESASSGLRIIRISDSNLYMYADADWADPND
ncbi:hypothetical protein KY285_023831 [Solanum tuberosum]|nr:hypothetical protein KY289_024156 [Solanum tuberosum]KAH0676030.1 hypothetical protein KY285_023831 [Solanum tuberosum]